MPLSLRGLALLFAVSGVLHLARPEPFERIVPHWLPHPRELVYASGVIEVICASGLAVGRTRRMAGLLTAATLVAVLPANVQMAVDLSRRPDRRLTALAIARLPLQYPLVRTAWRAWQTPT